ncbi:MAG: UpxY family transcription antiterminator [Deltaproteobacteria bacterium]|nr:UpxY family transcription antiterminator [Deltaproteobacteria bacterium]
MTDGPAKWYAVHTRSKFEQKVYDGILGKSIEVFLPKIQVMSRRKDRIKKILIPLIPGYVFVNTTLDPEEHLSILKTVGVVQFVAFKGRPVPARDEEIQSLMILNGTDRTVQNRAFMQTGDRIRIMDGPLKNLTGFYLRHKGQSDKVVVSVELINRSMEIDIEGWALEKLD